MGELRVLVTGSAGFIGSRSVEQLRAAGHLVRGADRDAPRGRDRIDLVDYPTVRSLVQRFHPNAVLHLAALASVPACEADPERCFQENVVVTGNVARAAALVGARLLFSSSAAVYGNDAPVPTAVSGPTQPTNLYGLSKLAGEGICRAIASKTFVFRLFNVYGEGCRRSYVIPDVIRRLRSRPPTLLLSGTGREARDFVYVGDVVRAFEQSLRQSRGGTFNVGSGTCTRIRDLVSLIADKMDLPRPRLIFSGARAGDFRVNHADVSGTNCLPRWSPTVPLDDGIERTLAAG